VLPLVAGIHVFSRFPKKKTWMAGLNPAMTRSDQPRFPNASTCSPSRWRTM
jgi:hypothetical protein